jgi:hypothetical protein
VLPTTFWGFFIFRHQSPHQSHHMAMTPHHLRRYPINRSTTAEKQEDQMNDPPTPYAQYYEIRLKGHLEAHWAKWFDGLSITLEGNGDTLLSGLVVDQAALHGLLKRVRDLGITLVSVNQVQSQETRQNLSNKE